MSSRPFRNRKADTTAAASRLFDLDRLDKVRRPDNEASIRALCANAYLGEWTSVCRVLGRYKMFVDTADLALSAHLLLDGFWEMWVTELMPALVRPGMTAVDVGANLGYYTLLLADLVGPSGFVHAFEPNPPIAERMRRSLVLNGFAERASVHTCALSDRDGDAVDLIVPDNAPGGAYVADSSGREPSVSDAVRVTTRRLDSYPALPTADFVKIDADTSEQAVWRGMAGLLRQSRPMTVLLEFAAVRYSSPADFLGELLHYGFTLARVDPDKGVNACTVSELLAASSQREQMLMLKR